MNTIQKFRSPRPQRRAFALALCPIIAFVLLSPARPALAAGVPAGGYSFTPTAKEAEFYLRIRDHANQKRAQMILDPRLCAAARKQAVDTQTRKFFAHANPDGVNSNQRAINEGFPLPSHYDPKQNYIESMAGSVADTPANAVTLLRSDAPHANHIFGRTAFYLGQTVIGVGHAPPNRWGYATYVFISAPGPVGQSWSIVGGKPVYRDTEVDAAGALRVTGAKPESILEVWKSGTTMQGWTLDRTAVVDASGRLTVGPKQSNRGFYRFEYFRP